jgi:hypothetical protein
MLLIPPPVLEVSRQLLFCQAHSLKLNLHEAAGFQEPLALVEIGFLR